MFKATAPGFLFLISSLLLWLLKFISRLMGREMHFFSMEEIFGIDWIGSIPLSAIRKAMLTVSNTQLSLLFLVLGFSLILIGTFQKE